MAAFIDIDRGTTPNDGTGDDLRTAFGVVNDNYDKTANIEEDNTFSGDNSFEGFLGVGARVTKTISSGVLTITSSNIGVSGEGGAADDLDTINGGSEGDIVFLSRGTGTITVTESGNIILAAATRVLSSSGDRLLLQRGGTNWNEVSYADNS